MYKLLHIRSSKYINWEEFAFQHPPYSRPWTTSNKNKDVYFLSLSEIDDFYNEIIISKLFFRKEYDFLNKENNLNKEIQKNELVIIEVPDTGD